MAVGSPAPEPAACGVVAGVLVRGATQLEVLGIAIDAELSPEPLLGRACSKLQEAARRQTAGLTDRGFGLPLVLGQLPCRAESMALLGTELLASHAWGWGARGVATQQGAV